MNLELILAFSALISLSQGLYISPHVEESEDDARGIPLLAREDYSLIGSGLSEVHSYAPRRKDSEINTTHPGLLPPLMDPTRPPSKCCWIWSCDPPMDSKSLPAGLISCLAM